MKAKTNSTIRNFTHEDMNKRDHTTQLVNSIAMEGQEVPALLVAPTVFLFLQPSHSFLLRHGVNKYLIFN